MPDKYRGMSDHDLLVEIATKLERFEEDIQHHSAQLASHERIIYK